MQHTAFFFRSRISVTGEYSVLLLYRLDSLVGTMLPSLARGTLHLHADFHVIRPMLPVRSHFYY